MQQLLHNVFVMSHKSSAVVFVMILNMKVHFYNYIKLNIIKISNNMNYIYIYTV